MSEADFIEGALIIFLVLVFLIFLTVVVNEYGEDEETEVFVNCTPAYAVYENETHYISQPVSGCRDSDFSVKAVLKNATEGEVPGINESKPVEVEVIIQDNTTESHHFNYTEEDCIGACELVAGFSNRSGFKSSSKRSTHNLEVRCGGIGERPCRWSE